MEQYLLVAMVLAFFMIVAAIVGYFGIREVYVRRYAEDRDGIRTKGVAEEILYEMLQNETVPRRKFDILKGRLGGLEDNELRRILLRLGAVRFIGGRTGEEYWGLLDRNRDALLTDVEKSIKAGEKLALTELDEEAPTIQLETSEPVILDKDRQKFIAKIKAKVKTKTKKKTKTKTKTKTKNKRIMVSSPEFKEVLSVVQDTTLFEADNEDGLVEGEASDQSTEKAAE